MAVFAADSDLNQELMGDLLQFSCLAIEHALYGPFRKSHCIHSLRRPRPNRLLMIHLDNSPHIFVVEFLFLASVCH